MKEVPIREAIGMALAHDLTQIIPGEFKGARFVKGHIVREDDIETLLGMGKRHLYVVEKGGSDVHEDDAALRIASAAAGRGIRLSGPREGKIELIADADGILKVDLPMLSRLSEQDEIMFASIHGNQRVRAGDKLAATRVIPLFVSEGVVEGAERACREGGGAMLDIVPLRSMRAGLVITGSEVYSGRVEDAFGPVLEGKFAELGSSVTERILADDDEDMIAGAIGGLIARGAEIVAVTGGMSVDPDDRTPSGIRKAGGELVSYGAPVIPGAMFLLAYIGDVPVVGLPGCVMYSRVSVFDLLVPRLLAGERLTRGDVKKLAHGGLCLGCDLCSWPKCGFGKS
ncbi:MAG: molybdopterin-binding protein [Clostridiales Family XIII bacterium]|nr:molybdopterin-binding protein [Clostridiales Family XIII bacterium]